MPNLERLRTVFSGAKGVTFATVAELGLSPDGTRECVAVENAFGRMVLALNGAHVMSWVPRGRSDVLWLSPRSQMVAGQPIRGGIPLCTPWFGPGLDGLPLHGWGRITDWSLDEIVQDNDGATVLCLSLAARGPDPRGWSVDVELKLEVTLGRDLRLALTAFNPGGEARPFEIAFHTYFAVGDSLAVTVDGLDGCRVIDRQHGTELQQSGAVAIEPPMNRIYVDPPATQILRSPAGTFEVASDMKAALIWNPGEGAVAVSDLGEGADRGFVCLERLDAAVRAVTLAPGATHRAAMSISVV